MGKLIDIGNYKLHLNCTGTGGPTVILDAGAGGNSLAWALIQPSIAKFTTVCSYDRAGLGWSEKSKNPRTSENFVEELRLLLKKAHIPGPYILVGHSLGGLNVQLYATKYPHEVAGLILVDSSHHDQMEKLPAEPAKSFVFKILTHGKVLRFLSMIGFMRLLSNLTIKNKFLPENLRSIDIAKNTSTSCHDTILLENENFSQSCKQVKSAIKHFGKLPIRVIAAAKQKLIEELTWSYPSGYINQFINVHAALTQDHVQKSINSKLIVSKCSGHGIPYEDPQIIIDAIEEMVMQYRSLNN